MTTERRQFIRGTDPEYTTEYFGLDGEITVDSNEKSIRVYDGATKGGSLLATKALLSNYQPLLTDEQLAAVNSGVDSGVVANANYAYEWTSYGGYSSLELDIPVTLWVESTDYPEYPYEANVVDDQIPANIDANYSYYFPIATFPPKYAEVTNGTLAPVVDYQGGNIYKFYAKSIPSQQLSVYVRLLLTMQKARQAYKVITAYNKTNKYIDEATAVNVIKYNQDENSLVDILGTGTDQSGPTHGPVLAPLGTYDWSNGSLYWVDGQSGYAINTYGPDSVSRIIYSNARHTVILDQSSDLVSRVCGGSNSTTLSATGNLVVGGTGLLIRDSGTISQINWFNGFVEADYENAKTPEYAIVSSNDHVQIGDYIYRLNADAMQAYKLDNSTLTYEQFSYTLTNGNYSILYPIGVTNDNKYIICSLNQLSPFIRSATLRIVEYVDENNLKVLAEDEIPDMLKPYYGTQSGIITFNPNNGFLAVVNSLTNYVIVEYANGSWVELPITIPVPSDYANSSGGFTFSNDGHRLAYGYQSTDGTYHQVVANTISESLNILVADEVLSATGTAGTQGTANEVITPSYSGEVLVPNNF